jgi:hypothetical protein
MSDTAMSPALKFYNNNKEKILAYKKQYYQDLHKVESSLKGFQIIGLPRRESNKLLKKAYNTPPSQIHINVTNQYGHNTSLILDSFYCRFEKFNGIIDVEAKFRSYYSPDEFLNIDTVSPLDYDTILETHILYLFIKYPLIEKN